MQDFKDKAQKTLTDRIKSYGGTPGRAAGGSMHSDAKEDRALVKSMVEPSALKRAAGGHVKAPKKPSTAVNIVIAPKGADNAPIGAGSAAPLVPPRLAPRPAPVPAPMPDGPVPAGPMGAKHGGAIKRAAGGKVRRDDGGNVTTASKIMTGPFSEPPYAPSSPSRIPKGESPTHDYYRNKADRMDQEFRDTRSLAAMNTGKQTPIDSPDHAKGGRVKRAAGGKVHMTAGAGSGDGRLEKIKEYGSKAGVRK